MRHIKIFFTILFSLLLIIVLFASSAVPTITLSSQSDVDNFNSSTFNGNLIIKGPDISDLTPLSVLNIITGSFSIQNNPKLTNIDGLSNLDSIGGNLTIAHNIALENIDGLSNLTNFNGGLKIDSNYALKNISGLSGLSFIGGGLKIDSNYSLLNTEGLKIDSVKGGLTIVNNPALTATKLSNLTRIVGGLTIDSNYALLDLGGLSMIDSIQGNLTIKHNIALENINGLSNLTKFNGGLKIDSNYALKNISGLSGLSFIGGGLKIDSNYSLMNIDGLSKIDSVKGGLTIVNNPTLTNYSGLFTLLNGNGLSGVYNVSGNAVNPKEDEILIEGLISLINNSGIPNGIMSSLTHLLENSEKSLHKGNNGAATNQLEAFINKLEAQDGKKINGLLVDAWINTSQRIIALIQASLAKNNKEQTLTSISAVPKTYSLEQNYPNPFNPSTTIKYALPKNEKVTIDIYDLLGRKVAEFVNGEVAAGYHEVEFNAGNLASGIYLYRLSAGSFTQVNKMVLMK